MNYNDVPILMYHDINDNINDKKRPWNVSIENFRQQIELLKKEGYRTITLSELKRNLAQETPEKLVVITFDDARSGVYKYAFPLLRQFGFQATVFVVPSWIENPGLVPNREKYSAFCTWEQLKEMTAASFEIGSHTFSHPNLSHLDDDALLQELDSAEQSIAQNLHCLVNHFCYPYGRYDQKVLSIIKQRYETAVTVNKGFTKRQGEYSRQGVMKNTSLEQFRRLLIKASLSLCMIVKNEEPNLERCLSSVQELVDEIIIVDTGSTDRTKEIAAKFTDKIYDHAWNDDFAAARNESLQHASGDWFLILDADEVIAALDFPELLGALNDDGFAAYQIVTRNYSNDSSISGWLPLKEQILEPAKDNYMEQATEQAHLSKSAAGWYPSLKVRLFRRQEKYLFSGRVHEMVDDKIVENGGKIGTLNVPIHHYGTLAGKSEKKIKSYLEISQKKLAENPQEAKAYYELGVQHKELSRWAEAEEAFQQSLKLDNQPLAPRLNLALVQQKQDKLELAMKNYQQILTKQGNFYTQAEAHFGLGFCYFKMGELNKALNHFLSTIKCHPDHLDASINAGAVYEKLGRLEESVILLKNALALSPSSGRAYYNLGVTYLKLMNLDEAIKCYEKAIDCNYQQKEELKKKVAEMKAFLNENKNPNSL